MVVIYASEESLLHVTEVDIKAQVFLSTYINSSTKPYKATKCKLTALILPLR